MLANLNSNLTSHQKISVPEEPLVD